MRGSSSWQVSQPMPGHLCIVGRVFQGVVPSRGAMAVELGFLSGHMTSLGYWGHLPACATRPAGPENVLVCHQHQVYGCPCLPHPHPRWRQG